MEPEAIVERVARVRRRFKAGRFDAMGRGFWEHWRPGDSSFLVGTYCSLILLFLEPSLWFERWPEGLLSFRVPGWAALALLLILPFNAWLLDRFLASKTPGDDALPTWLRGLRFLAASPPLFNLHTISLWKKLLEKTSAGTRPAPSRAALLDLSRLSPRISSRFQPRWFYRSGFLFGWIALSLLPVAVWALWLAGARGLGAWHRPLVLIACVFLHLVASVSMALHFQREIQKSSMIRWRRVLLGIAAFLWLLAIPGMLVGFALYLFAKPGDDSLSWRIHARRTGVDRDLLWQGHQDRLQQQWQGMPWFAQWRRPMGLSPADRASRGASELNALYRLKTFLLLPESLSLAALLSLAPAVARAALWIAAMLTGAGLAIQAVALLARLFRVSSLSGTLTRHPYGRYLLLTQAALLAGIYGGTMLRQISMEQFGLLLCLCGALAAVMSVLFLLLPTGASPQGPDIALWGLLYLVLSALGGLVALEGERWRSNVLLILQISAALSPFWSLGLFLALGGWLLRPFTLRHVFRRGLPLRPRLVLASMILTAVLPIGGLAVPLWIYARLRLWPQYEQEPYGGGRWLLSPLPGRGNGVAGKG